MELSEIPKPYKRVYDDKRRKKLLFIEIFTWRGTSIGAKHFYAKVYEDDNPILYGDSQYYFSEDKDKDGKSFGGIMDKEGSYNTLKGAVAWVINTILKEFPNHKVFDMSGSLIRLKN